MTQHGEEVNTLTNKSFLKVAACAVMMSTLTVLVGMKPIANRVRGWSAARRSQQIMDEVSFYPGMIEPRPYGRIG